MFMRGDGWRGTKLFCAQLTVAWLVLSLALCSGIAVGALPVQGAGPWLQDRNACLPIYAQFVLSTTHLLIQKNFIIAHNA